MQQTTEQQILQTLTEIRDDQREVIRLLSHQQALAEEQVKKSRATVEESINLQKLALQRQQAITRVALPAILVCIGAIVFLVMKYF